MGDRVEPTRVLVHGMDEAGDIVLRASPEITMVDAPSTGPLPEDVHGEVLLTTRFPSENLGAILERGVEWIHILGTGVNGFPFDLVGSRLLTCSRGASGRRIAEWCLAVMLAFEKNLPDAWIEAPPTPPARWHWADHGSLVGRTVAIVGLGSIARSLIGYLAPLSTRVRALRRTGRQSSLPEVEVVGSATELVRGADHLVVTAPATPRTHEMIDASVLAAAEPGLHLVNVSRGELIEESALRAALDDGTVAMASLDVFHEEPLPEGHWMYGHPRVRVSPHVSWSSPGAIDEAFDLFLDNVARWRRGEPLEGEVDLAEGY